MLTHDARSAGCMGLRFKTTAPTILLLSLACGSSASGAKTNSQTGSSAGSGAAGTPSAEGGVPAPPTMTGLAPGSVGAACNVGSDCASGRCSMKEPITATPFPGGYCTGSCLADSDCGARGYCVPGFLGAIPGSCSLRCASDADCGRDGYRCRTTSNASYCVAGPKPLPDNVVGNACGSDADCGGGAMTCTMAVGDVPAPLGYCTNSCSIDADCGAGGTCINGIMTVLSTGNCYKSCVPPGGCRDGYVCRSLSGSSTDLGACAPIRPVTDAGAPD